MNDTLPMHRWESQGRFGGAAVRTIIDFELVSKLS